MYVCRQVGRQVGRKKTDEKIRPGSCQELPFSFLSMLRISFRH